MIKVVSMLLMMIVFFCLGVYGQYWREGFKSEEKKVKIGSDSFYLYATSAAFNGFFSKKDSVFIKVFKGSANAIELPEGMGYNSIDTNFCIYDSSLSVNRNIDYNFINVTRLGKSYGSTYFDLGINLLTFSGEQYFHFLYDTNDEFERIVYYLQQNYFTNGYSSFFQKVIECNRGMYIHLMPFTEMKK